MLHGFMRSVTGSLSRLAMQHARRELARRAAGLAEEAGASPLS
jgi:hypothetical protein